MLEAINKLNNKQKEAALCTEGPLLILAGAGSGKTSTMVVRIGHLVEDKGIAPYNILAVTFTNKAATEMRERLEQLVGGRVRDMWIMTFHACCLRILKTHAEKLGYTKSFTIYDPTDQKVIVKKAMEEFFLDCTQYKPAFVLSVISKAKEQGQSPAQYREQNSQNPTAKKLASIYEYYQETLKRNNAMDFDDLILNAVRLLESDAEVAAQYQARFAYIMVDEYQDTNDLQYRLVKVLAGKRKNLCVVGDDDQCIYQWRGADIRNILEFERDFHNTKTIKLEQNYRSNGHILDAANSVIKNNKTRKQKKLWTQAEDGDKVEYIIVPDEKKEAQKVLEEIRSLKENKSLEYSDIAVLYRINAQSRAVEMALRAGNIPYKVIGALRYYDRKEIKDMISYLRLIVVPRDGLALLRVINTPRRGIGQTTIDKLEHFARKNNLSLWDTLTLESSPGELFGKASGKLAGFVDLISKYNGLKDELSPAELYEALLGETGYIEKLKAEHTDEADARIQNLLEFKTAIMDFEASEKEMGEIPTVAGFLDSITLEADTENKNTEGQNAVCLMTMHSSKGLEFPVVFIVGMEEGLCPSIRSADNGEAGIEEERRLCYVAITRAKKHLYILRAKSRMMYGKTNMCRESRFLKEIDAKHLSSSVMPGSEETDFFHKPPRNEDGRISGGFPYVYSKARIRPANTASPAFSCGDKVAHKKFGAGVVIEVEKNTISIMFDDVGVKKLATAVAPLVKV